MPARFLHCALAFIAARSHCPLAVSHTRDCCFVHVRLLFPARPIAVSPRSLDAFRLRARRLPHTCSLPRASSSASRFLLCLALPLRFALPSASSSTSRSPLPCLAPLRLAGKAEPGAKHDKKQVIGRVGYGYGARRTAVKEE
ncbi:hypothetical protein B0H13DRAFT_2326442 [Mycena leptocephala]|nr:hypothetical protein B0H13DRAFT_2326442 [Mycena leptocephala]